MLERLFCPNPDPTVCPGTALTWWGTLIKMCRDFSQRVPSACIDRGTNWVEGFDLLFQFLILPDFLTDGGFQEAVWRDWAIPKKAVEVWIHGKEERLKGQKIQEVIECPCLFPPDILARTTPTFSQGLGQFASSAGPSPRHLMQWGMNLHQSVHQIRNGCTNPFRAFWPQDSTCPCSFPFASPLPPKHIQS